MARIEEVGCWETSEDDRSLLAAVRLRRTDRGPLDGDSLPTGLPFLLQSAASDEGAVLRLVSSVGDRATLADLVARADRLLVRHGRVDDELAGWLREPGDPRPDGVPTDHTRGAAASYRAEFVQRDFSSARSHPAPSLARPDSPVVGVLCTSADRAADWLVAGQALGAVLLRAAVAGAHASYLNQPVEQRALRVELRDQLQLDGVPQLILRIGVGSAVTPTPRRDVDAARKTGRLVPPAKEMYVAERGLVSMRENMHGDDVGHGGMGRSVPGPTEHTHEDGLTHSHR